MDFGMATGVMNADGSIGGILSPITIGYLAWYAWLYAAFIFMGGALIFTALVVYLVKLPPKIDPCIAPPS